LAFEQKYNTHFALSSLTSCIRCVLRDFFLCKALLGNIIYRYKCYCLRGSWY